MPNNDVLPYAKQEPLLTPGGAVSVSAGVSVEHQATRVGLTIVTEVPGAAPNGNYSVVIQTGTEDDSAFGITNDLDRVDGITGAGTFRIYLSQPIIDKVRARVETDAVNPERLTFRLCWGSDTELTQL